MQNAPGANDANCGLNPVYEAHSNIEEDDDVIPTEHTHSMSPTWERNAGIPNEATSTTSPAEFGVVMPLNITHSANKNQKERERRPISLSTHAHSIPPPLPSTALRRAMDVATIATFRISI